MNNSSGQPSFMKGMFLSRGLAFWMAEDPPVDLLDFRTLQSENQWVILASLIERAKQGDFEHMAQIFSCLQMSDGSGAFWDSCAYTLSHVAPSSVLRQLLTEFHSEVWERKNLIRIEYIVDILYESLQLWTVPVMLKIFLEIGDREEINDFNEDSNEPSLILIPFYLSSLLEEEPGPIAEAESFDSDSAYRDFVIRTYEQRCGELGSPKARIRNGMPFSVQTIAKSLLQKIVDKRVDPIDIAQERMLFEATTGIDCRTFYVNFKIQPLAALVVLEKFLESSESVKFEDGVHYFFGHRVPD